MFVCLIQNMPYRWPPMKLCSATLNVLTVSFLYLIVISSFDIIKSQSEDLPENH